MLNHRISPPKIMRMEIAERWGPNIFSSNVGTESFWRIRLAAAQDENVRCEVIELRRDHDLFLKYLVETIRDRAGIVLDTSDVLRSLVDLAMEHDFSDVDVSAAFARAQALLMLSGTRQIIEREVRQTESDLHQTLVHSPNDANVVANFRRNIRYQNNRLESLDEQMAKLREPTKGPGNGAFDLLQALLSKCLSSRE